MNKAYTTLCLAGVTASTAVFYAHYSQVAEKTRMHAGVLRDIEREHAAAAASAARAAASPVLSEQASDTASAPVVNAPACDNGVCDLAQTRFRDPSSGQVYTPEVR